MILLGIPCGGYQLLGTIWSFFSKVTDSGSGLFVGMESFRRPASFTGSAEYAGNCFTEFIL